MGKMTERELRKLRRTELLEILLELRRELDAARQENESLREQLNAAEQERQEKTDAILELLHTSWRRSWDEWVWRRSGCRSIDAG